MKMTIIDTLKSSELFGGLETEQLEKISALCREVSYQAGATIFNERSEAAELYIVAHGRVVVEMEVRPVRNRAAIPTGVEVVSKGKLIVVVLPDTGERYLTTWLFQDAFSSVPSVGL